MQCYIAPQDLQTIVHFLEKQILSKTSGSYRYLNGLEYSCGWCWVGLDRSVKCWGMGDMSATCGCPGNLFGLYYECR